MNSTTSDLFTFQENKCTALKRYWGYDSFREFQEEAIDCILVSEGVSKKITSKLGLLWAESPQDAVKQAYNKFKNRNSKTYIINGDNIADILILPKYKGGDK